MDVGLISLSSFRKDARVFGLVTNGTMLPQ
jgi:hypothetical protein